jgi:hypothetical protein
MQIVLKQFDIFTCSFLNFQATLHSNRAATKANMFFRHIFATLLQLNLGNSASLMKGKYDSSKFLHYTNFSWTGISLACYEKSGVRE